MLFKIIRIQFLRDEIIWPKIRLSLLTVTVTFTIRSSNLECPNHECPNRECPNPECPNPECPNPECPNPECPNPECPNPECPNPECPNPVILLGHLPYLSKLVYY